MVLNPAAGPKPTSPDEVGAALDAASVEHDLVAPGSAEEAADAIREAAAHGRARFAVAGGDGTLNLAANTLLSLDLDEKPVLGALPAGTGCDLLRTFGIPQDLSLAARHLATDDTYDIDVAALEGDWGARWFLNAAQAGVGAAAVGAAAKLPRRMGATRYPAAFCAKLPRFPRAQVTVTTERGARESEALATIAANGQFFAGGWNVAPKATLIDGLIDIQVINAAKTRAPALVPKLIKGAHLQDPAVRRLTASEFTIETTPVWPVEADGDLVGSTPVSGRVVPAAIRLSI